MFIGAHIFLDPSTTYFFVMILMANMSVCAMIAVDFVYVRHRFTLIRLTVALFYSASAMTMAGAIVWVALYGIVIDETTKPDTSLFASRSVGPLICWAFTIIADGLQLIGHFYYC